MPSKLKEPLKQSNFETLTSYTTRWYHFWYLIDKCVNIFIFFRQFKLHGFRLLVQMYIKIVSSPSLSGIGMSSQILWSHLLKMQRTVLLSSRLWWELGTNSLITGPGEWLSFRRFTSKLSWSWSRLHRTEITKISSAYFNTKFNFINNKSIASGICHDTWKQAKVNPIFKTGAKDDVNNDRHNYFYSSSTIKDNWKVGQ